MSAFIFSLLALLWLGVALYSKSFIVCFVVLTALIGLLFVVLRKADFPLKPASPLLASKVILAISFFGCVAFCLLDYQKSIGCVNCIGSYLARVPDPAFASDFGMQNLRALWQFSPRFLAMSGLFLLWTAVFFVAINKKGRPKND